MRTTGYTYLLTYSMEQSPTWEANRFSAIQEIPHILWISKVPYRIHKCPPPFLILSHIYPIHDLISHFLKTHFNIILATTPGSSTWSLSITLSHQNPECTSPLPIRATCPALLILLDLITRTILGEEYKSLSSLSCSFLNSPVTSFLLALNILLSTLFSNTLSLHSPLNVSDQVSLSNKTTGKITVLYIWLYIFLDSKLEDKKFCTEW